MSKFTAPGALGPHTSWHRIETSVVKTRHIKKITIFAKRAIVAVWQGSEYASPFEYTSGSENDRVLNMPGLWIYHSVLNIPLVFNMARFWIYQAYTAFWICLIMPGYVWISMNMRKSCWMAFVLRFPILIPCLLKRLITYFIAYFNVCTKLVVVWRNNEAEFGFFIQSSWKYLIFLCFWLNIFKHNFKFDRGFCFFLVKTCKEIT